MIGSVTLRYAWRDLKRHPLRSALMIAGIAIGCAVAEISTSYMQGAVEMQVRAISQSGTGHLVVVPEAWPATREHRLRLRLPETTLAAVSRLPGLIVAMPRVKAGAMLAFGTRSAAVEMTAVSPKAEQEENRIVRLGTTSGRYLMPGETGTVVVGRALARRLDVRVDDDLVATTAGGDSLAAALLRIVGVIDTGSGEVDSTVCHVTLEQMTELCGVPGIAEIAMLVDRTDDLEGMAEQLQAVMPADNTVLTWRDINPEFAAGSESDEAFSKVMITIILIMVALGIAAAQLTAVLQRRRELAVLAALGMSRGRVVAIVVIQAAVIGILGAAASLPVGLPGAWYLATHGIPLDRFLGGDLGFGGILLDPVLYGDFGSWLPLQALGLALGAALGAAIYPAWLATRVDPAEAMRSV